MSTACSPCICRDEACDRLEIHLAHDVGKPVVQNTTGGKVPRERGDDDDERSGSARLAWQRSAPKALTRAIARATSRTYPKHYDAILHEVQKDYGACNSRTVQRHLRRLVERGHVLQVDLGKRLFAYLRPGSKMAGDIDLLREQISDLMDLAGPRYA